MKAITTRELQAMKSNNENHLLINSLDVEHFADTKIVDSVNIPQSQADFVSRVEETSHGKQQPIVVYCASEECRSSTKAAEKLEAAGFGEVYDYEGGAKAWQQAGESIGV